MGRINTPKGSSWVFIWVEHSAAIAVSIAAVAYRLRDFGRYGFWTDEAWVALVTRVDGLSQKWLAIGSTPPGWAATLEALSVVPLPPEVALRLLPLLGGLLTLVFAWCVGRLVSGHALGGLVAMTVVAFDPQAIEWSKVLKQYSVEFSLVLGAFAIATAYAQAPHRRWRLMLFALSGIGLAWATMLLLVVPPLLLVLGVDAARRGDRREAASWLLGGGLLGAWCAAWFFLVIQPRLGSALSTYWTSFMPTDQSLVSAVLFASRLSARRLDVMLGPVTTVIFVGALLAYTGAGHRKRVVAWGFWLLFGELILLAWLGLVPFDLRRVIGFLSITFAALAAGAAVRAIRSLATRRSLRYVIVFVLVAAILDFVRVHPWRNLGKAQHVEDAGALVQHVERERTPNDAVLVYDRSALIYAYYSARSPVLSPAPTTTVGYVPDLAPAVTILRPGHIEEQIQQAATDAPRTWIILSRVRATDVEAFIDGIERAPADVVDDLRRENARLLVLQRLDQSGVHEPAGHD